MINKIKITNANVHNLKNVSLEIPKNKLVVITGPSGSGKSSLAFDTLYIEGQRRYIESLSSYARQFLGQFTPPDVESIQGLSPAIAIDQKTNTTNPRSTVGTITEVYDYMRILFARVGILHCPDSQQIIKKYTPTQVTREIMSWPEKTKISIAAPIAIHSKQDFKLEINKFLSMGHSRCFIDNGPEILDENLYKKFRQGFSFSLVVDRVAVKKGSEKRLSDSIEYAYRLSNGSVHIYRDKNELHFFSEKNISPVTGNTFPELSPRLFSFNSPVGACPKCNGLGISKTFSENGLISDKELSLSQGAIPIISKKSSFLYKMITHVCKSEKIPPTEPLANLPSKTIDLIFYGSDKKYKFEFVTENSEFKFSKNFPGIIPWIEKKYYESSSEKVKKELEEFMKIEVCNTCHGKRLNPLALATKINGFDIHQLANMPLDKLLATTSKLKFTGSEKIISDKLLFEINSRLKFLIDVGLSYLTLNRSAVTLSGGESQRIRLATQIGSALSGVIYVLDEPSIGLHQKDNLRLIKTLQSLRDIGNTVVVVEHDEETIKKADHVIDIGPGAGVHGGDIVAQGSYNQILKAKDSLTAQYLTGKKKILTSYHRLLDTFLTLLGATQNNINNLDIRIPLNGFCCISGVSGSGKSTLVHSILVPALKYHLSKKNRSLHKFDNYRSLEGFENIDSIIELDQSPIGRTPHSNPATYTGLFDDIRKVFANTQESKIRGHKPGRFSFNVKGGRCEECEGNGTIKVEMHFLPDIHIICSECNGKRYNKETLDIYYRSKNIADVLDMTIDEAHDFFLNHPKIKRALSAMKSVGLGYIKLGQSATTLSGGEAQRLKISRELAKKSKGHTLYVLDEPTTGLHFNDISILLDALHNLIDAGNSVLVIEHNIDVLKASDYIIDLGPEGGDQGGQIVFQGPPQELKKCKQSYTARFL